MSRPPLAAMHAITTWEVEYLFRDHASGWHYTEKEPRHPDDVAIATRSSKVTETRWYGIHPDAVVTKASSDEVPTSITIEVERGDWSIS